MGRYSLLLPRLGLLALFCLGGCLYERQGSPQAPVEPVAEVPSREAEKAQVVDMKGYAFKPSELVIGKGETVTWTNRDYASHSVTSDSGKELDSGLLSRGQSYSHKFNEAGTYPYHCSPHPSMKGKIIVK